jgi:putative RNA 2'-phosphotransferase
MLRMCRDHGYFRGEECPICGDEGKFLLSDYELESLGRIMAGILRHFPERFHLEMDEEGFVDIYRMVSAIKRKRGDRMRWLRPTHIIGLVETDKKGRYQVENNHVRATYGHSIELSMSLPTDNIPERLYYPSTEDDLEKHMSDGLVPEGRSMVHLSKTYRDAYEAGSHRGGAEPIIVRIDADMAQDNGIIIQRAGKTVYTVEEIPADFITETDESDMDSMTEEDMADLQEEVPSTLVEEANEVEELVEELYSKKENNGDDQESDENGDEPEEEDGK